MIRPTALVAVLLAAVPAVAEVAVGSKRFTESYVLAEVAKDALVEAGIPARHRRGLGGTIIVWRALRGGSIDAYPDYTGTIGEQILGLERPFGAAELRRGLAEHGLRMTEPLGFDNSYALVVRRETADRLDLEAISDLAEHPRLRLGLTPEFLGRDDGWRPLAAHYGLDMANVRAVEHAIGYTALASGEIDGKDAYATDARIASDDLVVLADDRGFFPAYDAVFMYRDDLVPAAAEVLEALAGTVEAPLMRRMNAAAEAAGEYRAGAAIYRGEAPGPRRGAVAVAVRILRWTARHLLLVGVSLALAVAIGVPLGIRAARGGLLGRAILATTGAIYTVPSLALLALLVPLLGISATTAIVALLLYSLLPIVRNTASGLAGISPEIRSSADALGLEPRARLVKVELPMASRTILAGIKTAAILDVGTATLAALIGAGGLGEPIISGLNLNDHALILQGALPAAALALLVEWSFEGLDRLLIPRGLRL